MHGAQSDLKYLMAWKVKQKASRADLLRLLICGTFYMMVFILQTKISDIGREKL